MDRGCSRSVIAQKQLLTGEIFLFLGVEEEKVSDSRYIFGRLFSADELLSSAEIRIFIEDCFGNSRVVIWNGTSDQINYSDPVDFTKRLVFNHHDLCIAYPGDIINIEYRCESNIDLKKSDIQLFFISLRKI